MKYRRTPVYFIPSIQYTVSTHRPDTPLSRLVPSSTFMKRTANGLIISSDRLVVDHVAELLRQLSITPMLQLPEEPPAITIALHRPHFALLDYEQPAAQRDDFYAVAAWAYTRVIVFSGSRDSTEVATLAARHRAGSFVLPVSIDEMRQILLTALVEA